MTELWDESGNRSNNGDARLETRTRDESRDLRARQNKASKGGRVLLIGVLAVTLLCAPSMALGRDKVAEVSRESGIGAAAAIASLVYGPVKLLYATGGLVVGAFSWVFTAGDSEVAEKVFTRSLRGTYVITPEILLGEEPLEFIGRDVEPYRPKTESVAAADVSPTEIDESGYDEMGW